MKTKLFLSLLLALMAAPASILAQNAPFTYQGRLQDGGQVANGTYDLRFGLADADLEGNQVGPTLTNAAVLVRSGLFTVTLDFGPSVFDGAALWLEVAV